MKNFCAGLLAAAVACSSALAQEDSTERPQIGQDQSANAGFRKALGGGIATELTFRNQFSAFDDVIVETVGAGQSEVEVAASASG